MLFCVIVGSGLGGGAGLCDRTKRKTHQGQRHVITSGRPWCRSGEASIVNLCSCYSGGGRSVLRGRVHRGQWRQRPWLADEAQREAVAAGKNIRQLLPSRPCLSNHRRGERWETTRGRSRTSDTEKGGIKHNLANHAIICDFRAQAASAS